MTRVGRAVEKGETQGFMKVVVDAETKQILGAAILGIGGDEVDPRDPRRDVRQGALHGRSSAPCTSTRRCRSYVPTMLGDLREA